MKTKFKLTAALALIFALVLSFAACTPAAQNEPPYAASIGEVPEFSGAPYAVINGNRPFFEDGEITADSFESYSELDGLGRCGVATASVGEDLMPTDDREGSLSSVTPSGWVNAQYDIVSGGYLYNRAHLIGWQLTGETTNEKNLITGTRFMNVEGMLPFENMVADYIKESGNHVMYRVTPIFEGRDLVASGVLMEGYSVEDAGDGICFCIYVYNNQPGISINYATGESKLDDGVPFPDTDDEPLPDGDGEYAYVLNTSTKKIHSPSCHYAESMAEDNKEYTNKTLDELIADGYAACGSCKPK